MKLTAEDVLSEAIDAWPFDIEGHRRVILKAHSLLADAVEPKVTERAPETIAAEGKLDDRFTFQVRRDMSKDAVYAGTEAGAYLMLRFPSKPTEVKYLAPRDQEPMWLLMFADADKGYSLYPSEAEGREAFAYANQNWTCTLFATVPVQPKTEGVDSKT